MSTLEKLLRMKVSSIDNDGKTVGVSPEFRSAVQSESEDDVYIIIHGDTLALLAKGSDITDLNQRDCPHAGQFRYCPDCVKDPCPIGMGGG